MLKNVLMAAALSAATITPAWSGAVVAPPKLPPPHTGLGPGPWIAGGVIVSAVSLMVCGVWECATSHKEMTNEEAIMAATIPFSCFWWRQYHREHGPTCSSYRKP
jgi:hypothetical protein